MGRGIHPGRTHWTHPDSAPDHKSWADTMHDTNRVHRQTRPMNISRSQYLGHRHHHTCCIWRCSVHSARFCSLPGVWPRMPHTGNIPDWNQPLLGTTAEHALDSCSGNGCASAPWVSLSNIWVAHALVPPAESSVLLRMGIEGQRQRPRCHPVSVNRPTDPTPDQKRAAYRSVTRSAASTRRSRCSLS